MSQRTDRKGAVPIITRLLVGPALVVGTALVAGSFTHDAAAVAGAAPASPRSLADQVNEAMGLDRSSIIRIDGDLVPGVRMQRSIEIDGRRWTLAVAPHSVRSPDYRVYHSDAAGNLVEVEPGPVNTVRGLLVEDPASLVAGGVFDGGFYGRVFLGDGSEYWIEPVAAHVPGAPGQLHVVYQADDLEPHDGRCGVTDVENGLHGGGVLAQEAGDPLSGAMDIAELAADCDFTYFDKWGEQTEGRVNLIIDTMDSQYERDVDISHHITTIIIRTSRVYSMTNSAPALLNEFRNRWNAQHGDISRDVAQLYTSRFMVDGVLGIAQIATICDLSNAYNLIRADWNNILSCTTDLSAHELGHNWSAGHCTCGSHTMNPTITCANQFHPTFTIPTIAAFRDSRTCLDNPVNDVCIAAISVGDGSFPFTTEGASTDGDPLPNDCDEGGGRFIRRDIWYIYTASCTGTATANICDSEFNNRIAVYDDIECPGDVLLSCNDFFCGEEGTRAETTFPVTAGETYLVRIGGVLEFGTGTLVLSCVEGGGCPADFDGSGSVDFNDLLELLANWGPCEGACPWDLDDNDDVGFNDLLALLAAWGPCEG